MKLPFSIDNAIVRLQCAAQAEGEAIEHPDKLPALQKFTNRMREELEAVIFSELQKATG
jgi:hypothetical protein